MPLNLPHALTLQQLSAYDGSDPLLPIYVAVKGVVFDVSSNPSAYGKHSNYNCFAGKDASKALGLSSLNVDDCVADYSTLNNAEMVTLGQWLSYFTKKYPVVGHIMPDL
ncbi:cytochrome b5-like heme/steroid binding domain-containing protein [Mucor lusitanicus]|uniref:Cytochrome b5-like heme/steroid binding domain-containing protein n=1 Tax=Mucor circinelloides f. lusitanicus TaxID=29924 RepID=A0A8H4EX23_MUCCL|nr:cytochrome b5-like heme/steroid binding domain-containing protein [Mucor lusitanicus]